MATKYDPRQYWSGRVGGDYDLAAVGRVGLSRSYNRVAYGLRLRALRTALRSAVAGWPHVSLLEAGFGVGYYLSFYRREGVRSVAGIDISSAAVEGARSRFPEYDLVEHDMTQPLPFVRHFDVVTAIDVLYHIVDDGQWSSALGNLADRVADHGVLILTDKFPAFGERRTAEHVKRRSLSIYEDVLHEHHLVLESLTPVFVFMDDALPDGVPGWLGRISDLQWRIVRRSLAELNRLGMAGELAGVIMAGAQYPLESLLLAVLDRTPNTALLVARRR